MNWRALNPSVPRPWLMAIAGLLWCGVGAMLWLHAAQWLRDLRGEMALPLALGLGLGLGLAAHLALFLRLARKNLARLRRYPARACLFAFQAWRGYLMIALMIGLGIALRHSPIPRHVLAVLYGSIGTALILSGSVVGKAAFVRG